MESRTRKGSLERIVSPWLIVACVAACPEPAPVDPTGSTGDASAASDEASGGPEQPTESATGGDTGEPPATGGCVADGCCDGALFQQCVEGDVHAFDECGADQGVVEACPLGTVCVGAACVMPAETCGDGVIDPGEACDGFDIAGATCEGLGFGAGALACNLVCSLDTSGCCIAEATHQCVGNDVFWFDGCGGMGELKEQCFEGTMCMNTSETTATCVNGVRVCGNGVIDPGESCDGEELGGATCAGLGFDRGVLGCTGCQFDTGACMEQGCWIEADPGIGSWTPEFSPQTNCTCGPGDPDCHTLYQGRVDAIAGNMATMSFHKSGGGGPSVLVDFWVVVGGEEFPACYDLPAYVEREQGKWAMGLDPLQVDVAIWPSEAEFEAAAPGATKRLFVMSGGSDDPTTKRWFQKQSILFTKKCG